MAHIASILKATLSIGLMGSSPATDRREGGVGELQYPLVSDIKREISDKYGVLTDDGVALRGLFIIDKEVWPSFWLPPLPLLAVCQWC